MEILLGGLLFLFVGFVAIAHGYNEYRRRQLLLNAPEVNLPLFSSGQAKVVGTVRPATTTFPAPITGEESVAVAYFFKHDVTNASSDVITDGVRAEPFYIETDTDRVLVYPDDIDKHALDLDFDEAERRNNRLEIDHAEETSPDSLRQFRAETDGVEDDVRDEICHTLYRRYRQLPIRPGDTVVAIGTASQATDAPPRVQRFASEHDFWDTPVLYWGSERFLLSNKTVEDLVTDRRWTPYWALPVGLFFGGWGCLLLLSRFGLV